MESAYEETIKRAAARYRTLVELTKKGVRSGILKRGNLYVHANIFNLPQQVTCPAKTEMCARLCYAAKATGGGFVNILASRLARLAVAERRDFPLFIINDLKHMRNPFPITRIHESGDFYSEEYAKKWVEVFDRTEMKFQAYTKVIDVWDWMGLLDRDIQNFTLAFSFWYDNLHKVDEILGFADVYTYVVGPTEVAWAYKSGYLDELGIYDPIEIKGDILDDPARVALKPYMSLQHITKKLLEKYGLRLFNTIRNAIIREFFGEEFITRKKVFWCTKETRPNAMCVRDCRLCYAKNSENLIFFILH